MTKILFISNGHGEDLNGSLIVREILKIDPKINLAALPIVGEGNAYRQVQINIIGPTQNLPSGGIFYLNHLNFIKDLFSGLIDLTIKQFSALKNFSKNCDLIVVVGDIIPIIFAWLTGSKFVAFLVSSSSYYENKLTLPFIMKKCLQSSRCLKIFTRDKFTAIDLQKQGFKKAIFAGYPIVDVLKPLGKDLQLSAEFPTIALLPGSRLPEALRNLQLQLQVCEQLGKVSLTPLQFRAALVPSIKDSDLELIARQQKWQYLGPGKLGKNIENKELVILCYNDAFADILAQCNLVLGMAGTAVEQAIGLGKSVVQIPGKGPQFTYRFAEAQMRLLGMGVTTIKNHKSPEIICQQAAAAIINILQDDVYLQKCVENGKERVGEKGGSRQIAIQILKIFPNHNQKSTLN
jgi:uncharacterized protein (TIGR03492 family)